MVFDIFKGSSGALQGQYRGVSKTDKMPGKGYRP